MSAPVVSDDKTVGVIQVSRKGRNSAVAGPDFTPADLRTLELAAEAIAPSFRIHTFHLCLSCKLLN